MGKICFNQNSKYVLALFVLAIVFSPITYQTFGANYRVQASILNTEIDRNIVEPFVEPIFQALVAASKKSTKADQCDALFLFGEYYRQRGRFEKAITPLRDCLKINEQIYGPDNPMILPVLESLEDCLQRTYDNNGAASITQREIELYAKPVNQRSASAYADAAYFSVKVGDFDTGLRYFRKADEYYVSLKDSVGRELLHKLLEPVVKNASSGASAELSSLLSEKLPAKEKSDPTYLLLWDRVQANPAPSPTEEAYELRRIVAKGDAEQRKELKASESVPWKVVEADALTALGEFECARGRLLLLGGKAQSARDAFLSAKSFYERGYVDCQRELEVAGKENPLLADSLQNLQHVYVNLYDWNRALGCAEKRARLSEIGENQFVGMKTSKLAMIYHQNCQFKKSQDTSNASLTIFRHLRDLNWQAMELQNWAETLKLEGRYDDAEKRLLDALNLRERSGIDHVSTALVTLKMGQLFALMERPLESRLFTDRTQRLRRVSFAFDHPYVAYGKLAESAGMLAEVAQDLHVVKQSQAVSRVSAQGLNAIWERWFVQKTNEMKRRETAVTETEAKRAEAIHTCHKARNLIKEALPVVIREDGAKSRRTGEALLLLARSFELEDARSHKQAIRHLLLSGNEAIEYACRRTPNHIAVARAKQRLGKFYAECGDNEHAQVEYLKGIRIYHELFRLTPHTEMAQLLKDYCDLQGEIFETSDVPSAKGDDLDQSEALLRLSYAIDKQLNKEGAELRWNSFLYWADEQYKALFQTETKLTLSNGNILSNSEQRVNIERLLNHNHVVTDAQRKIFESTQSRPVNTPMPMIRAPHTSTSLWTTRAALLRASALHQRIPIVSRLLRIREAAKNGRDEYLVAWTALDITRALKIHGQHDTYWANIANAEFIELLRKNLSRGDTPSYTVLLERSHLIKCLTCVNAFRASDDLDSSLGDAKSLNSQLVSVNGIESGYLLLSELFFRLGAFPEAAQSLSRILENRDTGLREKALAGILASRVEVAMMHTDAGINLAEQAVIDAKRFGALGIECSALECLSEALEQEGDRLLDASLIELNSGSSSELRRNSLQNFEKALREITKERGRFPEGNSKHESFQILSITLQSGELQIKLADLMEGGSANEGYSKAEKQFRKAIDDIDKQSQNANPWRILNARARFGLAQALLKRDGKKSLRECEDLLFKVSDMYLRDESASSRSSLCSCYSLLSAAYLSDGNKSRAAEQIFRALNICEKNIYPRVKDMSTSQKCVFSRFLARQNDLLIDACSDEKIESKDVSVAVENKKFAIKHFAKVQGIALNISKDKDIPPVSDFDVSKLQSRIGKGEQIIDIVKFRRVRFPMKPEIGFAYVAISHGREPVIRKLTIDGKKLLKDITSWDRFWLKGELNYDPKRSEKLCGNQLKSLRNAVWQEIEKVTGASKRLYLCVDSSLSPVAWRLVVNSEALGEKKLKVEMCELNVLADMLIFNSKKTRYGDLQDLIVADIAFKNTKKTKYPYLGEDTNNLFKLFARNKKRRLHSIVGPDATKQKVLEQMSRSRTILISSHGDYLSQSSEEADLGTNPDPFDRSCLVLLPDHPGPDFVYLKATEILKMDLSSCELVILSACSTGTGSNVESQGLLGLRSAFLLAGAKCALVSLCPVNKYSTSKLIEAFYAEAVAPDGSTKSTVEALFDAQKAVSRDAAFKPPYYWANWTIVGNGW